jgi:hypothetical protein
MYDWTQHFWTTTIHMFLAEQKHHVRLQLFALLGKSVDCIPTIPYLELDPRNTVSNLTDFKF